MNGASSDIRTLWVGDIEPWMSESHITEVFSKVGKVISVKLIRSKETQLPAANLFSPKGYCFVEFSSHEEAEMILMNYNSQPIAGVQNTFRMNWGKNSTNMGFSKPAASTEYNQVVPTSYQEYSVYVGDLELGVTEPQLLELFRSKYMSAISTKIISDPSSRLSKGYGFVKFSSLVESQRSIHEMNGYPYKGKFLKVSPAVGKFGATPAPISAFGSSDSMYPYNYYGGQQMSYADYYSAYSQSYGGNPYAAQYAQYGYPQSYYGQDMYGMQDSSYYSAVAAYQYPTASSSTQPAAATTAAASNYYQPSQQSAAQYAAAYQQQADYYASNPAYAQQQQAYAAQQQQQQAYPSAMSTLQQEQMRSLQLLSESSSAATQAQKQQQSAATATTPATASSTNLPSSLPATSTSAAAAAAAAASATSFPLEHSKIPFMQTQPKQVEQLSSLEFSLENNLY